MKRLLLTVLLVLIPLQLGFLYLKTPRQSSGTVAGINQTADVENSVSIGEFRFSLFGYTSPLAQVTFEGMGIFDQTTSDDKGYFQFNNRFSPFSSREACLSSKDQFGRLSSPVCLPPFPVNYNVSIGPVIMPPTVSLDKLNYFVGDEVVLSGQTIPDSEVNLSMFTKEQDFRGFLADFHGLVKSVEAFSIPLLSAKSDVKGNFSISLPSSQAQNYRLFTQVDFQDEPSTNSLNLFLQILPVWMIILKFFLFLFSLIKPRLLEILIVAEIIYILYILKGHIQDKSIILRKRFSLMKSGSTQIILSTPNDE